MFLIFNDSSLGKIRLSINAIAFYRQSGDSVLLTTNTGQTLRSKEHSIPDIDAALNESYNYIKTIPKVNNNNYSTQENEPT
jgi:hypothetical protein